MTVSYTLLDRQDGWTKLKCFFGEHGRYGEFFLKVNKDKGLIEFEAKDDYYADVLTAEFEAAMHAM